MVYKNGFVYWQGAHKYFGAIDARSFVFKTDDDLNAIDSCYDLSDTDEGAIIEHAITFTIFSDLKVDQVLLPLDLSKPHYMYGSDEPFTTEVWDVNGLYPLPDSN